MRFETLKDLQNEYEAITVFCDLYDLECVKLGENDIDFSIIKNGNIIGYAEIKGRNRNIADAYPLPISCRKLVKLQDKKINPIIIWRCFDGIIYGKTGSIVGEIRVGGRIRRQNSINDVELMAYYDKQIGLNEKYL
jgi:hypothetical protein